MLVQGQDAGWVLSKPHMFIGLRGLGVIHSFNDKTERNRLQNHGKCTIVVLL